ncbi:gelsolin repeat protein [Ancylostoma duodenale]|uniref:Gelsolin repeat protein n=1 Tax=Ancylostoma duodenale TaxID=51022 RepID=A0A0C2GZH4_9BILA|nr:gelsolin repeat protein [Ancylostoma duodenale]
MLALLSGQGSYLCVNESFVSVSSGIGANREVVTFGEWEDSKKKKSFEPRLFQVSDESGKMVVEEIANFDQESLDGDDVMILDALNVIYVWVGAGANQDEKKGALNTAKKYLEQGNLPRHKKTTIETIFQGQETPTFKKFFPSWDDELFKRSIRIRNLIIRAPFAELWPSLSFFPSRNVVPAKTGWMTLRGFP